MRPILLIILTQCLLPGFQHRLFAQATALSATKARHEATKTVVADLQVKEYDANRELKGGIFVDIGTKFEIELAPREPVTFETTTHLAISGEKSRFATNRPLNRVAKGFFAFRKWFIIVHDGKSDKQLFPQGMATDDTVTGFIKKEPNELHLPRNDVVPLMFFFRGLDSNLTQQHMRTVVSYAVYKIPRIRDALIAAAKRGVRIRLIVETPNRIEGQGEYDCLLALGDGVASACSIYYWPQENRPTDENGKIGILHVKCAVADGRQLFLSSANLTDYAFTIEMELGLLVTVVFNERKNVRSIG